MYVRTHIRNNLTHTPELCSVTVLKVNSLLALSSNRSLLCSPVLKEVHLICALLKVKQLPVISILGSFSVMEATESEDTPHDIVIFLVVVLAMIRMQVFVNSQN